MASILDQLSDPIADEMGDPLADEVVAENTAPNAPTSPSPADAGTVDNGARTLSVAVSDPDKRFGADSSLQSKGWNMHNS